MKQALILAGGKGTRLSSRLGDLPKPLIPIGGRPLLEHQVELAREHGFDEVLVFSHHRARMIEAVLGDGRRWGLRIRHLVESEPLGPAGAVLAEFDRLADRFLVIYGDTMLNVDLGRLWKAHAEHPESPEATLLLHPNDHPLDSDLVEVDATSRIVAFHPRPHDPGRFYQNLVNAGLYAMDKRALEPWRGEKVRDFGGDLFPRMVSKGSVLCGYRSPEYIKDIGTPERYDRVCLQYAAGLPQRSSLSTPRRAVFLDRDGTLVKEVGTDGLSSHEGLELLPRACEAVAALNQAGFLAVVVTNQPVLAKGFCTTDEMKKIHNKLETLLGLSRAHVDGIYLCPHHPNAGYEGEVPALKVVCDCRKPGIALIRRAAAELNIDLSSSWFVGDTTTDIRTARNAGLRSILVKTGYGGTDRRETVESDFVCKDVFEASKVILGRADDH